MRRVGWLRAHLLDPVSSRGGTALPQGLRLEVSRVELGALRATVCYPAGPFSRVLVNAVQQVLVQPESRVGLVRDGVDLRVGRIALVRWIFLIQTSAQVLVAWLPGHWLVGAEQDLLRVVERGRVHV